MTKFATLVFALALLGFPASGQVRLREIQRFKQKQLKPAGIPGPAIRRFFRMGPEERQAALDRLPPVRRAQLEQRLERLERMRPEDRERTIRRMELFDAIPPRRRPLVQTAIQRLRGMPAPARQRYLESEDAKLRFDPDELELLRDVSGLPPEVDAQ